MYSSVNNYKVSTTANGVQFADKVYQIFGPYNHTAGVARPFDSPDRHVAVDGFDFDLEVELGKANVDHGRHVAVLIVSPHRQQALHRHDQQAACS